MPALCRFLLVAVLVFPAPTAYAGDREPRKHAPPVYPEIARRVGIQGMVKVQITIAADGQVVDAKSIQGSSLLSAAALDAVKHWIYAPSTSQTTQTVEFVFHP